MKPFIHEHRRIDDVDDFIYYCEEQIEILIQDLSSDERYSYELDPEEDFDLIEQGAHRGLFHKSEKFWENLQRRYWELGKKLYPSKDVEIRILGLID